MNFVTLSFLTLGVISMCVKIYLHYKLIEPQKRSLIVLARYFGVDFFLPIQKKYNTRRLESRRINANRVLALFYSCIFFAIVFIL